MWHQQLMKKIIANDSALAHVPVVQSFNATLCPAIMRQFADVPALGGDPNAQNPWDMTALADGRRTFTLEARQRFSVAYPDQSLAAHLINGVFAGYRLAGYFPQYFQWGERLWRIWTLGFVLHDYGKAVGREFSSANLPAARETCRKLGEILSFQEFFPEWMAYLDEVLFLAQNTQTVVGAVLSVRGFDLQMHPATLNPLRMLASFDDILLHVEDPREVAHAAASGRNTFVNLREKLDNLFPPGQAPVLAYHQVAEVRGLLTNVIHNAIQGVFARSDYLPYLYFANGVVYLRIGEAPPVIGKSQIAEATWRAIVKAVTAKPAIFLQRSNVGIKVASPLYEFLDSRGMAEAGRTYAAAITNGKTPERLAKYGKTAISLENLASDVRCDRLAEFLQFFKRNVIEKYYPDAQGMTEILLEQLRLTGLVSKEEAERQGGGVGYGWFYVAAVYFARNGSIQPEQVDDLLRQIASDTLSRLDAEKRFETLRVAVEDYVMRAVSFSGMADDGVAVRRALEQEFSHYLTDKAMNRWVCSLCSSPYSSEEQTETVVLFKPQQYSAKNRLGGSRVKRGICPICSLEMLLRQAHQEASNGKFQDMKAINLAVYPSYFFTPETAQLVKECVQGLRDLNLNWGAESLLATLRHASNDGSLSLDALLEYQKFLADVEDNDAPRRRRTIRPSYSTHEFNGFALFSVLPEKHDPTDTDSWILPAFYALAMPLLLNVKVVASGSFVPLYSSATELTATTVLDGPYAAIRLALQMGGAAALNDQFRVGSLRATLKRLLSFYDLHTSVFGENFDAHWGQLSAVVRDVLTDPYYVFSYYDRKKRGGAAAEKNGAKGQSSRNGADGSHEGVSPWDQRKYLDIYGSLGGAPDMGTVGDLVTSYARFYRAQSDKLSSAYSVLKPLATAIDVTVNSYPAISDDDLVETISGNINDLIERVRDRQADGWDPIITNKELGSGGERLELSRQAIHEFAALFVRQLFLRECDGDRAILRERANQLRSAARFYYLTHFTPRALSSSGGAPTSNSSND